MGFFDEYKRIKDAAADVLKALTEPVVAKNPVETLGKPSEKLSETTSSPRPKTKPEDNWFLDEPKKSDIRQVAQPPAVQNIPISSTENKPEVPRPPAVKIKPKPKPPNPLQNPIKQPLIARVESPKPEAQKIVHSIAERAPILKQESRETKNIPLDEVGREIINKEYYRLHKSLRMLPEGMHMSISDFLWEDMQWYAQEQKLMADGYYVQRNAQATREELYYYTAAKLMVNEKLTSVQALKKVGVEFSDVIISITKREILKSINQKKDADYRKNRGVQYEKIAGRKQYKIFLKDSLYNTNPFPLSTAPENIDALAVPDNRLLYNMYLSRLGEYECRDLPKGNDKTDFIRGENEGYKLHLNVPVAHVMEVSEHLIQQNYCHKYLSGGSVPGSIFTIYIGSHQLAFDLAKKLSEELSPYLAKPARTDEIELAPNIVGRFCALYDGRYAQYGYFVRGMVILNDFDWCFDEKDPIVIKKNTEVVFEKTYESLADDYGEYFHGCGIGS